MYTLLLHMYMYVIIIFLIIIQPGNIIINNNNAKIRELLCAMNTDIIGCVTMTTPCHHGDSK